MGMLDAIQWLATLAITFIPWLLPNISQRGKLEIVLLIIVVSLIVYCARLCIRLKAVEQELSEIRRRHNALSAQFDEKVERVRCYRRAFQTLFLMVHISLQNTKTAKLKDIYEAFARAKNEIDNV